MFPFDMTAHRFQVFPLGLGGQLRPSLHLGRLGAGSTDKNPCLRSSHERNCLEKHPFQKSKAGIQQRRAQAFPVLPSRLPPVRPETGQGPGHDSGQTGPKPRLREAGRKPNTQSRLCLPRRRLPFLPYFSNQSLLMLRVNTARREHL